MKKLNLPPFYLGQKVVYIENKSLPKNSIHEVIGLIQHSCGCWIIEVPSFRFRESPKDKTLFWKCAGCGLVHPKGNRIDGISGIVQQSFRPIQQQKFPLISFSKIVEIEKEEILINN